MGQKLVDALSKNERAKSAVEEILKYYHYTPRDIPQDSKMDSVEQQLEYRLRPFGIMYRTVTLDSGWYKNACGPILGTLKEDGNAVALIPGNLYGYYYYDPHTGKKVSINKSTQQLLDDSAICFYKPLPQKKLKVPDLLRYAVEQLTFADIAIYVLSAAIASLMGLLAPLFTKWLFGDVLKSGSLQGLLALASFMICFSFSRSIYSAFQALVNSRVRTKQNVMVQAAVMNRILSLPTSFFRQYSSGELQQRAVYVQSLCSVLFTTIGTVGLTSLFSLVYIGQIFKIAPNMVLPAILITGVTLAFSIITTFAQMKISEQQMNTSAQTSGLTYSIITGIQKIKLAGAEKRMFVRWANQYSKDISLNYNPPTFIKINSTITSAISLLGTLILYYIAVVSDISIEDYYAFNASYGMVSGAFMSIASIASTFASIRPTLEMAKPIMEAVPEAADEKEIVRNIRGSIELQNVSFRYNEDMPNVLDNLTLSIKAGEYIGIVGTTGCGKSTLLRILLGFETPQKGSVFYDKKDISQIDVKSLRRNIGVVLQDGKLFWGDIFSNIAVSSPNMTLDEAWEAAEMASVADDIRAMPMGMNTIISDGHGGISGGQRQRLLIARAIASKPKILMFDEATSALDNITQKSVSDAISGLKCTRIVIAHRLSTIRHCDRIIVLDKGKIVEEGTYDSLIEQSGFFAELVERQRLDE